MGSDIGRREGLGIFSGWGEVCTMLMGLCGLVRFVEMEEAEDEGKYL